jgi:hypothetical protein
VEGVDAYHWQHDSARVLDANAERVVSVAAVQTSDPFCCASIMIWSCLTYRSFVLTPSSPLGLGIDGLRVRACERAVSGGSGTVAVA